MLSLSDGLSLCLGFVWICFRQNDVTLLSKAVGLWFTLRNAIRLRRAQLNAGCDSAGEQRKHHLLAPCVCVVAPVFAAVLHLACKLRPDVIVSTI